MNKKLRTIPFCVTAAILLTTIGFLTWHKYGRKGTDLEPQKSIEEILAERERQASGELQTPTGQALLTRNWESTRQHLKGVNKPHLHFANIIRALYIQNKISEFNLKEIDEIENIGIELLEIEPIKDLLGYGLLTAQLNRLPLLSPEFSSRKKLETLATKNTGGPYHEQAKVAVISKLIVQGVPPSEKIIQEFQKLQNKIPFEQWIKTFDSIRHAPTQQRVAQAFVKNWKNLSGENRALALNALSASVSPPKNKEVVLSALSEIKSRKSASLLEASIRYLSALEAKAELSKEQRSQLAKSLKDVDLIGASPFLTQKVAELLQKLEK